MADPFSDYVMGRYTDVPEGGVTVVPKTPVPFGMAPRGVMNVADIIPFDRSLDQNLYGTEGAAPYPGAAGSAPGVNLGAMKMGRSTAKAIGNSPNVTVMPGVQQLPPRNATTKGLPQSLSDAFAIPQDLKPGDPHPILDQVSTGPTPAATKARELAGIPAWQDLAREGLAFQKNNYGKDPTHNPDYLSRLQALPFGEQMKVNQAIKDGMIRGMDKPNDWTSAPDPMSREEAILSQQENGPSASDSAQTDFDPFALSNQIGMEQAMQPRQPGEQVNPNAGGLGAPAGNWADKMKWQQWGKKVGIDPANVSAAVDAIRYHAGQAGMDPNALTDNQIKFLVQLAKQKGMF